MKTGAIKLEQFLECRLPQRAATAWSAADKLVGATYKPLIYVGEQVVNGTAYHFVAERTLLTNPIRRNVVKFAIVQKPDGALEKTADVELF